MIVANRIGDVTQGPETHVAFAINTTGKNDGGLAGEIMTDFWPELSTAGPQRMGQILTKDTGRKVFHALVVHTRSREGGWTEAPRHIEACFNQLEIPTDEEIASVAMGNGMVGFLTGADVQANLAAMERSNKSIVVYDLF